MSRQGNGPDAPTISGKAKGLQENKHGSLEVLWKKTDAGRRYDIEITAKMASLADKLTAEGYIAQLREQMTPLTNKLPAAKEKRMKAKAALLAALEEEARDEIERRLAGTAESAMAVLDQISAADRAVALLVSRYKEAALAVTDLAAEQAKIRGLIQICRDKAPISREAPEKFVEVKPAAYDKKGGRGGGRGGRSQRNMAGIVDSEPSRSVLSERQFGEEVVRGGFVIDVSED